MPFRALTVSVHVNQRATRTAASSQDSSPAGKRRRRVAPFLNNEMEDAMPLFRIHVERIDGDTAGSQPDSLTFEARNHDDILAIVRRVQNRPGMEADEAAALAVGLKLFSEVLLKRRKESPYAELQPHMREFIGAFKAQQAPTDTQRPM